MRTERGFGRLVGFSDGVVAIAITLLILPLVDAATHIDGSVWTFLQDNSFRIFVFVLSFLVIGRFWFVHHALYENAVAYNSQLLWANLFWLLTIVFQPFSTELLASGGADGPLRSAIYVGTMLLTCVAALLQQLVLLRYPELRAPGASLRVQPYVTIVLIMALALVVAVLIPRIGLLALLLLAISTPLERALDRARKVRQ